MSNFTVVIPVLNQFDTFRECFQTWVDQAKGKLSVLLIDNGSDSPLDEQSFIHDWRIQGNDIKVVTLAENVGVYPTFDIGYSQTNSDYIFYSHSDVKMLEYGWDERITMLLKVLGQHSGDGIGVCGMFGARGLGTPDIYKTDYKLHQLQRWGICTVASMVDAGGEEIDGPWRSCLVLDGFSLICSRKMLDEIGGFDYAKYTDLGAVHHMYDNRICLRSHFGGFRNYVLDIDCKHLGGVTSCGESWAEKFSLGSDQNIHRKAHEIFYEEFRGKLPASV